MLKRNTLAATAALLAALSLVPHAMAMRQEGHVYADLVNGHCLIRVNLPSGGVNVTDYGSIGGWACGQVQHATLVYYSWMYNHAAY